MCLPECNPKVYICKIIQQIVWLNTDEKEEENEEEEPRSSDQCFQQQSACILGIPTISFQ